MDTKERIKIIEIGLETGNIQLFSLQEIEEEHDVFINDMFEPAKICGIPYPPSCLKLVDEDRYETSFEEYLKRERLEDFRDEGFIYTDSVIDFMETYLREQLQVQ